MLARYKIGLRTIKTAIAVFLCLLVHLVFPAISALNASIAAIVCMRETPGKSFETGLNRFVGTIIGGFFGYILIRLAVIIPAYEAGLHIAIIPLGMILCISACVWFKKHDAVVICCVVYLIIALEAGLSRDKTLFYVGMRIVDTMVGIVFATLINKFFFPYRGEKQT